MEREILKMAGDYILCHLEDNIYTPYVVWRVLEDGGTVSGWYFVSLKDAERALNERANGTAGWFRQ